MNKKIFPTIFLVLFFLSAFGQFEHKTNAGQFGISVQVCNPTKDDIRLGWFNIPTESIEGFRLKDKSIGYGITALYNLDEPTTLRLGLNISQTHILEYKKEYNGGTYFDDSNNGRQTIYQISPGIIWKLPYKKLNLYGGFEGIVRFHGAFTMDLVYNDKDSTSGAITHQGEQITKIPKGNSYGIGGLFGFEYNFTKWFSVGGEFSPSLSYAKLSGQTTTVYTSTVPSNPTKINYTQDEDKGLIFYDTNFSIGVSFWF